jgi:hypothetical protein
VGKDVVQLLKLTEMVNRMIPVIVVVDGETVDLMERAAMSVRVSRGV